MIKICCAFLMSMLVLAQNWAEAKHMRLSHKDWAPDVKQAMLLAWERRIRYLI